MDNHTNSSSSGSSSISSSRLRRRAFATHPKSRRERRTPHVRPQEIASETQKRSEVKAEPPKEIALQVENQSEVIVKPKSERYKHSVSCPPRPTWGHGTPPVPPNKIALGTQNRYEVKIDIQDKISLQNENQSEGKFESRLQQNAQDQSNEETTEWALLIISVLLEAMSAVFDQLGYALTGMVIAFLALFLSSLDLICKARKEGGNWSQPFGGLLEYFGLAAAVWQCFYSTMEYLYTRKNQQNPIKMSLLPFIFALCVLIFRIIKCRT